MQTQNNVGSTARTFIEGSKFSGVQVLTDAGRASTAAIVIHAVTLLHA